MTVLIVGGGCRVTKATRKNHFYLYLSRNKQDILAANQETHNFHVIDARPNLENSTGCLRIKEKSTA